jgi:SAM-dependent methyltransferase
VGGEDSVRQFYERYPYPPPVQSLDAYRHDCTDDKRRADHHLFWPARAFRSDPSILVAGCGTSQAAKHAMRWPAAKITAIDASDTSVRATEALKRRYDLKNLDVRRLPIERAGELDQRFDQIVCTGVLHHLADPDAGLRALAELLAPDGAMHVMVYAPYGRAGVYMMQAFCRHLGIRATTDGIRKLAVALEALPPGHPLETLLREAPDFRNEASLADALLHPRDRAYSVPQLFEFVSKAGLGFGRWLRQAPYSRRCGVLARIPQSAELGALSIEEQYAAIELFRGTMVRHSVILHRDDGQRVDFDGDAWRRWVPIRTPGVLCIRERLPPKAAAVLINPLHTYRDLYLPIDAGEKLMLDAIDGRRTIDEIASVARATRDESHALFERLYWHDQIVVDAH